MNFFKWGKKPKKAESIVRNEAISSISNNNLNEPFLEEKQRQEEKQKQEEERQEEEDDNFLRFLLVGHQNRTKEYLINKINDLENEKIFTDGDTTNRFSNCSILKLILIPNGNNTTNLQLKLIYTGDSNANKSAKKNRKYKYWVSENWINKNWDSRETLQFEPIPFPNINIIVSNNNLKEVFGINSKLLNKSMIFYFLRHGYSYHNAHSGSNTYTNTELIRTNKIDGIQEAKDAGIFFNSYIKEELNKVCVSDLIRTQQTASYFLQQVNDEILKQITEIYVLPCFHEIKEKGKDENYSRGYSLTYRENNTNCRDETDYNKSRMYDYIAKEHRKNCSIISIGESHRKVNLNWNIYKEYNDGKYRDQLTNENPCVNKNFLGIFINKILYPIKFNESLKIHSITNTVSNPSSIPTSSTRRKLTNSQLREKLTSRRKLTSTRGGKKIRKRKTRKI